SERGLRAAVAPVVREASLQGRRVAGAPRPLGVEPLGLCAPEPRPPALGEPARVPHVVGMEVGDDDARERAAAERLGEHALPQGARLLEPDPRVHGRPPRAVLEEPQVDVVQPERERHAEPLDAWENVDDRPGAGRLGPRVAEAIVSTTVERGSPARPNSAATTGRLASANAGKSNASIVRWSQRVTARLSP